MEKVVLGNGLKLMFQRKPGNAVVVEVMVNVGSNHELPAERGISHFLEHMVFEGTPARPTNQLISNEIEKIGGEFNAYTTGERTCFYVKVLKKHFLKAVEILADILQNPLFDEKYLEKEKKIVLKEIDMLYDEPRMFQWVILQQHLFRKHPCRFPTYGDRSVINKLTRKQVVDFYQRHYQPNNMVVSIVGNVKNWKRQIQNAFVGTRQRIPLVSWAGEPLATKTEVVRKKSPTANTYLVMGFKGVPLTHQDAPVFEVMNGVLGRGQSGRMFTEIRTKRGLAYDVGTQSVNEISFGYFAIYATIDRKNEKTVVRVILTELAKLKQLSALDLQEAKDYVEGSYYLELEDAQKEADQLLVWEQARNSQLLNKFIRKVKRVSAADVRRVVEKYFRNYTLVVLQGK